MARDRLEGLLKCYAMGVERGGERGIWRRPKFFGRHLKIGDLVIWTKGGCEIPGIVIDTKPHSGRAGDYRPGASVLALLPELPEPEWLHESELETCAARVSDKPKNISGSWLREELEVKS